MEERDRPLKVYLILLVGVVSFAFSSILVRLAGEAPGMAVATWRSLFTVAFLGPYAVSRVREEVRAFSRRDMILIATAGVFLALHFTTWIESLYYTSVASSTVLVTTSPIFLALLGFLFLGERLARAQITAVLLGVFGAALIGMGDAEGSTAPNAPVGNALAFGAAVMVSIYMLIGRSVRQRTTWLGYVFPLYTVVAIAVLLAALFMGVPLLGYSPRFYVLCALMSLGPQLIGHGAVNYGLRYFPAAIIGVLTLLEPVGASTIAFILFDEKPGILALSGMAMVLLAVVVTALPQLSRRSVRPAGR